MVASWLLAKAISSTNANTDNDMIMIKHLALSYLLRGFDSKCHRESYVHAKIQDRLSKISN